MSSFFSLKNKLGLISLVILALNFAIPHVQATSTEEIMPKAEYDYSSPKDLVFLSIHKIADLYYVVMVKQLPPQDEENKIKNLSKANKDEDKFKVSLKTSRKEVKEENIRKLTSSPSPYHADLFPE